MGCHCLLRILLYCTLKNSYDCFLVIKRVKRLPAMPETWVQSSGQKNPLEKGMATHSSPLARNIPWTEEPAKLSSPWGHKESQLLSSRPIRLSYSQPSPHPHLPRQKGLLICCLCRFLYILHMGGITFTIRIIFRCTTYHILLIRLVIG